MSILGPQTKTTVVEEYLRCHHLKNMTDTKRYHILSEYLQGCIDITLHTVEEGDNAVLASSFYQT